MEQREQCSKPLETLILSGMGVGGKLHSPNMFIRSEMHHETETSSAVNSVHAHIHVSYAELSIQHMDTILRHFYQCNRHHIIN